MKLTIALIVLFNFQMFAKGYSQSKVTLNLTAVDFKKVVGEIEKRTVYRFLYSKNKIPTNKFANVNANNLEALSLVDELLVNTPYTYQKLENNLIVIIPKGETVADTKVTGTVLDENDQPLIGVTVTIKGTTAGAVSTDLNGVFHINVPGNAVLTVSFVGYDTQDVPVDGKNIFTVKMKPTAKNLNEVVVVGYGTQKKADVTTAIASVNSNQITRLAVTDPTAALQGQVPGATVIKNVGKPGAGYSVTVRGVHSIGNVSNEPLYVIDGIPTTSGLNDLNPADIEKIDVLKDASAASIYGSRGAKGVVIVTTKRGKAGKTQLTFDSYVGTKVPIHLPQMMNSQQYVDFRTEQNRANGRSIVLSDILSSDLIANYNNGVNTNWPDLVLKNAVQMNHNVTAAGGDEKTRFSVSAGLNQEDGNVAPENYKKYSLRGNVDRQITDQWKAGLNLYLVQALTDQGSSEALRSSYRLPSITYPYDASGNPVFRVFNNDAVTNPFFDQQNELRQQRVMHTFGNLYVQFQPITELTVKSTISPNYVATRNGIYYGPLSKQSVGGSVPTQAQNNTNDFFSWVWDNQATYDKQFGDHHITGTVIQSMQSERTETSNITASGLPYKSLWYNLGSGGSVLAYGSSYTKYTLASFTGRVNYNYKDKYLFTATGRYDGSSHFAVGHQWGFFPSASAAWRISQEDFMKKMPTVNDLKLRLSYGSTGNDRIAAYSTQANLGQTYYDFGGVLANGYAPGQLANQDLTWETTREWNLGVDFSLFNSRISGSVDAYSRTIQNILFSRQLPPETGFTSVSANVGQMRNQGIEVGLNTINIQTKKFQWRTDFALQVSNNKLLSIYGGTKNDVGSLLFIGQPVQVNYDYVFDGIWQTSDAALAAKYNQKPGQIRVKDLDGNGVINANDKAILGQKTPKWDGSIGNTFKYGNLDLYVLVYTRRGEMVTSSYDATFLNFNQNYNQMYKPYWTATNPSNTWWQPGNPGPYSTIPQYRKLDFTRINNITLGYTFPAKLLKRAKISSLRVYATASNPFLFTKYDGFDPEWASQNTYGIGVSTAAYLIGINLGF
ncbi:TonB-dependent receptor [Mucilaginibacter yixingensis]|nr:TonB-dependent receptor [Mucilaginibacter yixingensis]